MHKSDARGAHRMGFHRGRGAERDNLHAEFTRRAVEIWLAANAVSADEPLRTAAQLMSEHGVSHLIVVDNAGGYPLGVISTLDIATIYAHS